MLSFHLEFPGRPDPRPPASDAAVAGVVDEGRSATSRSLAVSGPFVAWLLVFFSIPVDKSMLFVVFAV